MAGACSDEQQPEHCRGLGEPCSRGGASEVVALVNSRPAASAPALGRRRRRSSSSSSSSSRRGSSSGHSRSSSAAEDCIAVCEAPPVAPPVGLEAARLSRGGDIKVEALWRSLVETWTAVRLKMKVTRETSSRCGGCGRRREGACACGDGDGDDVGLASYSPLLGVARVSVCLSLLFWKPCPFFSI